MQQGKQKQAEIPGDLGPSKANPWGCMECGYRVTSLSALRTAQSIPPHSRRNNPKKRCYCIDFKPVGELINH